MSEKRPPSSKARAAHVKTGAMAKADVSSRLGSRFDNPHYLGTAEEVAEAMEQTVQWMSAARKAGAPFPLSRSRPEWLHAWLQAHPELNLKDFQS